MLWFKHVKQYVKQKTLELRLPDNPTQEDLVVIENYLKSAKKKLRKGEKECQIKIEIISLWDTPEYSRMNSGNALS